MALGGHSDKVHQIFAAGLLNAATLHLPSSSCGIHTTSDRKQIRGSKWLDFSNRRSPHSFACFHVHLVLQASGACGTFRHNLPLGGRHEGAASEVLPRQQRDGRRRVGPQGAALAHREEGLPREGLTNCAGTLAQLREDAADLAETRAAFEGVLDGEQPGLHRGPAVLDASHREAKEATDLGVLLEPHEHVPLRHRGLPAAVEKVEQLADQCLVQGFSAAHLGRARPPRPGLGGRPSGRRHRWRLGGRGDGRDLGLGLLRGPWCGRRNRRSKRQVQPLQIVFSPLLLDLNLGLRLVNQRLVFLYFLQARFLPLLLYGILGLLHATFLRRCRPC
mmetsp:Transcript_152869/g.490373  ORF Transcript_152869/g.490373 Transcript_152869/m.490373 type:complete len:333 (-) Transcript_152869:119-1117(-)